MIIFGHKTARPLATDWI